MKTTVRITIGDQWLELTYDPSKNTVGRSLIVTSYGVTIASFDESLDLAIQSLLARARSQR